LVDSLMHALAAVLHVASVDGCGLGFGVVVFLGVVFGVVLVVVDDSVVVLGGVDVDDSVVVVGDDGGVVVVTGRLPWPAARSTLDGWDEHALSTPIAAIAAPMTSFLTRMSVSLSSGDPLCS
jgi:hypothetical protein